MPNSDPTDDYLMLWVWTSQKLSKECMVYYQISSWDDKRCAQQNAKSELGHDLVTVPRQLPGRHVNDTENWWPTFIHYFLISITAHQTSICTKPYLITMSFFSSFPVIMQPGWADKRYQNTLLSNTPPPPNIPHIILEMNNFDNRQI